jgi:hypothetical protein
LVELLGYELRPLRNIESSHLTSLLNEKRQVQNLIGLVIEIVLDFKDREIYDELSLTFIKADLFGSLIRLIVYCPIESNEYKSVARIFELCACH